MMKIYTHKVHENRTQQKILKSIFRRNSRSEFILVQDMKIGWKLKIFWNVPAALETKNKPPKKFKRKVGTCFSSSISSGP